MQNLQVTNVVDLQPRITQFELAQVQPVPSSMQFRPQDHEMMQVGNEVKIGNQIQENIVPDNSVARAVPTIPGPNHDLTKKQIVDCPHTDRRYYAKGMCVNCYHRRGRTKKAWNCPHTKKTHYSKGLCKYCYLASYYKSRTTKRPAGYSDSNASFEVASQANKETEGLAEAQKLEEQPNRDFAVHDETI